MEFLGLTNVNVALLADLFVDLLVDLHVDPYADSVVELHADLFVDLTVLSGLTAVCYCCCFAVMYATLCLLATEAGYRLGALLLGNCWAELAEPDWLGAWYLVGYVTTGLGLSAALLLGSLGLNSGS